MEIPFASSPTSSLGVEWELMLVSPDTRALTSGAGEVLAELAPGGEHPKVKHELLASTLEVITGVCSTVGEATADLQGSLDALQPLLAARDLALMCAGTHPVTHWSTQQISPDERYDQLIEDMQWLARRLQIFGVHVHVGVRSADKAMPIVNALTAYVPHLLALSSSSPYWQGRDTGLSSARSKVFEALPTAGLPFPLPDWPAFEDYMGTLVRTGTIRSIKEVWWDIRPHPDFGTVELRICDGLPTLHEIGAVAALSQCLVDSLDRQIDDGYTLPVPRSWVVRENKWRAARYGLEAVIIRQDDSQVPVREALLDLAAELAPTAERLGCAEELARVPELVERGSSAERQRRVAQAHGGDLSAVVDSLLAEFEAGHPL